ncbi:MAG: lysozyme inhibitor LprI family protein [Sphingorhabdus sp.]
MAFDNHPGHFSSLLAVPNAWLKYTGMRCVSERFTMHSGSAKPVLVNGCHGTLTRERTTQLRDLIEGY